MRCMNAARRGTVLPVLVASLLVCGRTAQGDFVFGEPGRVANINSDSSEGYPQISRDGLELYFQCNRPYGGDRCHDDIWVARRSTSQEAWGTPVQLDAPINSEGPESGPSLSADGLELYFTDGWSGLHEGCTGTNGYGGCDLWVATRASKDDSWGDPVNLGEVVNTSSDEDQPSISADGLSLYFVSNRPGGFGNGDIYVTTRTTKDYPWETPVNLGSMFNTWQFEATPFIAPDGLSLFFSLGTWLSDIYVSRRESTTSPWGAPVPFDPVNLPGRAQYSLSFSDVDFTLYFTRGNDAFDGASYDIWQVEVTPVVDFNGDAIVDTADVSILTDYWGQNEPLCDISPMPFGDGVVDGKDLEVLYEYVDGDLVTIPSPAFRALDVAPSVRLSWTRSALADSYDVYFGTTFADVEIASWANPMGVLVSQAQDANTYDPAEPLDYGRTYYWRVDEVNGQSEASIVEGMIWSFTTGLPTQPIIKDIVVTASSATEGAEPEHTIDGSGMDAGYAHTTDTSTMWLSAADGPQPTWIQYEFDGVYAVNEMWVWNYNERFEQVLGMGFKDVAVEYSQDGIEWMTLRDVEFAQGTSETDYGYNTVVDFGGVEAKYVRLTAQSNWGGMASQYGLSEVRFFYIPPEGDQTEATDD